MGQGGKLTVECNPSAFKYGVTEADIRFAFDNRLFEHPVTHDEDKNLLIGLDARLNPLEIRRLLLRRCKCTILPHNTRIMQKRVYISWTANGAVNFSGAIKGKPFQSLREILP